MEFSRRQVLRSAATLAAVIASMRQGVLPSMAEASELYIEQQPYTEDFVRKLAEALAKVAAFVVFMLVIGLVLRKRAAGRQDRVADDFGFEPAEVLPPEELVIGIDIGGAGLRMV